jgi:hypothetical protein
MLSRIKETCKSAPIWFKYCFSIIAIVIVGLIMYGISLWQCQGCGLILHPIGLIPIILMLIVMSPCLLIPSIDDDENENEKNNKKGACEK